MSILDPCRRAPAAILRGDMRNFLSRFIIVIGIEYGSSRDSGFYFFSLHDRMATRAHQTVTTFLGSAMA